jgi:hypothetical protein
MSLDVILPPTIFLVMKFLRQDAAGYIGGTQAE